MGLGKIGQFYERLGNVSKKVQDKIIGELENSERGIMIKMPTGDIKIIKNDSGVTKYNILESGEVVGTETFEELITNEDIAFKIVNKHGDRFQLSDFQKASYEVL
jgi:hypothetical protein